MFTSLLSNNTPPTEPDTSKPFVLLVHGLHQSALYMEFLAKKLQNHGFHTFSFDYDSLGETLDQHSDGLNDWLETNHDPQVTVNMVGHSLGGLVIRDFIARYSQWQIGRCVTLGTPHSGSIKAKYIKDLIPPLIGKSYEKSLDGNIVPLKEGICLGVIAGNVPNNLSQVVLMYHGYQAKLTLDEREHDGAVFVYETRLPSAADHIVLPVSHMEMLVDDTVAYQTAYFLKQGKFKR